MTYAVSRVCHGSQTTSSARRKPTQLQAIDRERERERGRDPMDTIKLRKATDSCHNCSSAKAFPTGVFVNQTLLQVTAFAPKGNAAAEDPVRFGSAPKIR